MQVKGRKSETEKEKLFAASNHRSGAGAFLAHTHTRSHIRNTYIHKNKEAKLRGVKPPEEDAALEAFINSSDNSCF